MSEENKIIEKTEPGATASELSEHDLEHVAGGSAFNSSKSGIKVICPKCGQQPCVCKSAA